MVLAQNILLIGTPYSGSTALGRDLNLLKDIYYAGELSRLPQLRAKYGHYNYDAECMACYLSGVKCPVFNSKNNAKICAYGPAHALNTLRKLSGQQVVVDSSKYVDWLNIYEAENNKKVITKVLIVVKNPLHYLQSCDVRGIGQLWQEANAWRDTYFDAYRAINRFGIPSMIVRNEDYKKGKSILLKRVTDFLNLENTVETKPHHAVGGNAGAYKEDLGKKILKKKFIEIGDKKLAQEKLALNPNIVSRVGNLDILTSRKKYKYSEILHNTPMLLDIANLLGYQAKDFS